MKKKILYVILIFIAIMSINLVFSSKVEARTNYNSELEYEENEDGGITVYATSKSIQNITIPSTIDGKNVTEIGKEAFRDCKSLKNIELPDTLETIGDYAFYGCYTLNEIHLPNSVVEIGRWAFSYCKNIQNVTIPYGVSKINWHTFQDCEALSNIEFLGSITKIDISAFEGCKSLKVISLKNVNEILPSAFEKCTSLTCVENMDKLKYIPSKAFKDCIELKEISIPDGVQWIGEMAFYNSGITEVIIPKDVINVYEEAFKNCKSLTNVTFLQKYGTKIINDSVFEGCTALTNISLDGVTEIKNTVFKGCSSLISIEIPNTVTQIEKSVLQNCSNLEIVKFGNAVKSIGESVFLGCNSLRQVSFNGRQTEIGENIFEGIESSQITVYGYENSTAENYAKEKGINFIAYYYNGKCGENIEWKLYTDDGTLVIAGNGDMYGIHENSTNVSASPWAEHQSEIKKVVFNGNITSIGDRLFEYNTSIESITLPSTIKKIGVRAFAECTNLKSVYIPDGIARIWECAFYKCTNLENVDLNSNSIIYIYQYAFDSCNSLKNIKIDCENVWIEDTETSICPNTTITGYKYSGPFYYARYYGINFKNIINGEVSKIKITPQSYLELIPTENVKALGVSSIDGYTSNNGEIEKYDLSFCIDKDENNDTYKNIKAKVDELTIGLDTKSKAKAIALWVYSNMEYKYFSGTTANINGIYNAFNTLVGSCESYTMLTNYMLYLCGIPTATVTDTTHEWTVAYIDGQWVYLDSVAGVYGTDRKPQRISYVYGDNLYVIDDPYVGARKQNRVKVIPFKDANLTDWYYNAVKYVYEHKIMSGINTSTFAPDQKLTRGMIVTMLYNMENHPSVTGTSKFADVQNKNVYFYNAVVWASNNNVVSGYANGKFGPDDNITREQLATILYNYCRYKGKYKTVYADYSKFSDSNKISSFAKWGMNWAVGNKIVNGSNGKLNPQGTATRAEAAAMISNYCNTIK